MLQLGQNVLIIKEAFVAMIIIVAALAFIFNEE